MVEAATISSRLRFRILGSLECWSEGRLLRLGGAVRERTLVMLLLEANHLVPLSRLVEAAWDDDPPSSAAHQVRKAVADLRQRIPDGQRIIRTEGPGYRAVVDEDQLDLFCYRAAVRRARLAVEESRPAQAAEELTAALELWRGPVMAGAGGPVVESAAAALEEQHCATLEKHFELRLAQGESTALVGELRPWVNRYPLRETLRALLMRALYQAGRQAEALEEYGRVRTLLSDELGIDPSAMLSDIHQRILRQSPDLLAAAPHEAAAPSAAPPEPSAESAGAPAEAPAVRGAEPESATAARPDPVPPELVPNTLPYDLHDFSGRKAELLRLVEAAQRGSGTCARILAVDGMGGSGKTALAVRAAHHLAESFPDGQLFVDLHGFTPGQEPLSTAVAVETLLAGFGVSGENMPGTLAGRLSLWQSITRRRRVLVVLDNAVRADQVRAIVPSGPDCLVLVTSRPRLVDLDGAEWYTLGRLSADEGMQLLRGTLGNERVAREEEAASELVQLCGGLPLAGRIVAARLRNRANWSVQRMVERLRDETRRLEELHSPGRSVAMALRLSYQSLETDERAAFRLLGLHPAWVIGLSDATALLGEPEHHVEQMLESLVDAHLLEERDPGWYQFHDLVRSFAQGLSGQETAARDDAAIRRLLDHHVLTADRAASILVPGRQSFGDVLPAGSSRQDFLHKEDALVWLDQHRDGLLAGLRLATERGFDRHAACLPRSLALHSEIRNHPQSTLEANASGVAAARRLGDDALLMWNLITSAGNEWNMGRFGDGIGHLEEALDIARSAGDTRGEAACIGRLGQFHNSMGEFDRALHCMSEASRLERELGLKREEATSLNVLGSVQVRLGHFEEAVGTAERAERFFRDADEPLSLTLALCCRARALVGLSRPREALSSMREALAGAERTRGPGLISMVAGILAEILLILEREAEARALAQRCLTEMDGSELVLRKATAENSVGRVLRKVGDIAAAAERHSRAYEIASRAEFRYEMAQALDGLADVEEARGRPADGRAYRRRADALFAEMKVPDAARRLC